MITSNIKAIMKGMSDLDKEQIPFAISKALNDTAKVFLSCVGYLNNRRKGKMITLKDVMNSNTEISTLEGTSEEILAKGLIISYRDIMSHIGDINDGIEVSNELFLTNQANNMLNLLSLLNEDVVLEMFNVVDEDTKKRVRK